MLLVLGDANVIPVITLAKETLGWEPRFSIEGGLKETVAYLRKLLSA